MSTLCTIVLLSSIASPTLALADANGGGPAGGPRVRPQDGRTATLLLEGIQRSDTLRSLVEQLEHRDVIVYLETEPRLKGHLAGRLTWLAATRAFRYVRVAISPDLTGASAIGTLGHELHHALEVANEPSIVDDKTLDEFYRRTGIRTQTHRSSWDTEAARIAGDEVRREASTTRSLRLAEVGRDFEPDRWRVVYRMLREQRTVGTAY